MAQPATPRSACERAYVKPCLISEIKNATGSRKTAGVYIMPIVLGIRNMPNKRVRPIHK
jgi:hypothetical protein